MIEFNLYQVMTVWYIYIPMTNQCFPEKLTFEPRHVNLALFSLQIIFTHWHSLGSSTRVSRLILQDQ
jgi:hypothetical protein